MLRFAPSPTGDIHIGNLRVAIINYVLAIKFKKNFILRIEDTDLKRNVDSKDRDIIETMNLFELKFDALIYQSDNFQIHRNFANYLLNIGAAFYCYCPKDFLEEKKQEAKESKIAFRYKDEWNELFEKKIKSNVIRFKANEDVSFFDEIRGEITFKAHELDSFVIMRNDIPTYNFACSIDDKDMDLIIRGEDHISNTPKQILIKKALGFEISKYAHLPIILNDQNKKMSKRDDASSVKWLLKQDLEVNAIMLYLLSIGNSNFEQFLDENLAKNITLDDIANVFELKNISKSSARFDYKKLISINRKLLRQKKIHFISHEYDKLLHLYLNEVNTKKELEEIVNLVFLKIEDKRKIAHEFEKEFDILVDIMKNMNNFHLLSFEEFKDRLIKISKLKSKNFFKPLRVILSGRLHGIEINLLYEVIKHKLQEIINN